MSSALISWWTNKCLISTTMNNSGLHSTRCFFTVIHQLTFCSTLLTLCCQCNNLSGGSVSTPLSLISTGQATQPHHMRNVVVPLLGVVTNNVGWGELECFSNCDGLSSLGVVRNVLWCAEHQCLLETWWVVRRLGTLGNMGGLCWASASLQLLRVEPSMSAVTNVVGCTEP